MLYKRLLTLTGVVITALAAFLPVIRADDAASPVGGAADITVDVPFSISVDTNLSVRGDDGESLADGIDARGAAAFGVYANGAPDFSAVSVTLRWDHSLASLHPNLAGAGIPDDILDINGVRNLRLAAERNVLASASGAIAAIREEPSPGTAVFTFARTGAQAEPVTGGLLCFAVFVTASGFPPGDTLTVTADVRLYNQNNVIAEAGPVTAYILARPPSLAITSPSVGVTFSAGSDMRVSWDAYGADRIGIDITTDGGESWENIADDIASSAGSFVLKAPQTVSPEYRVRIRSLDRPGIEAVSGMFSIERPPVVRITALGDPRSSLRPIRFHIVDPERRMVSLTVSYRLPGVGSWETATTDRNISQIAPDSYSGLFNWWARDDLGPCTGEASLTVTARAGDDVTVVETSVAVDYNDHPLLTVTPVAGCVSGTITTGYSIRDTEGDPVDIEVSFSTDDGRTWREATVAGEKRGLTGERYDGLLSWITRADIPGVYYPRVLMRIAARDSGYGESVVIGPFSVDNHTTGHKGSATADLPAGIPVLAFHNVEYTRNDNSGLSVTPDMFERIVDLFEEGGYSFLSTGEYLDYIIDGVPVPRKSVLLHFDDGYRSLFTRLFPILQRRGIKVSMNIICSQTGSSSYLSSYQIGVMHETGLVDFQSHSFNLHGYWNGIPFIFPIRREIDMLHRARVLTDLQASIDYLRKITGEAPSAFVVPYGIGNERTESFAREAGFRGIFYIGEDVTNSFGDDPSHLERITVSRHNARIIAKLVVNGRFPEKHAGASKMSAGAMPHTTGGPSVLFAVEIPGGIAGSSPAIGDNGVIYVGSWNGRLYAVGAEGGIRWSFATGGGIVSTPAVGPDGTVYVGSYDRYLYAVNAGGALKWRYDGWAPIFSSPSVGADGSVTVGSTDGGIITVGSDSVTRWNYRSGDVVYSSPAVGADGTVYAGTWNNQMLALNGNGAAGWICYTGGGVESSPAIGTDGTVYFGCMDGYFMAVRPDGNLAWKHQLGSRIESSPVIGPDGVIYIGGSDGFLYAFHPNGSLAWRFETGGHIDGAPAVGADGVVYAGSWDGYLYAVGPDGVEKWRFQTGGGIDSSPVIDDNGILYFSSSDSWLYGIDTGAGTAQNDSPWPFFRGNIRRTGVSPSTLHERAASDIVTGTDDGVPLAFGLDHPRPNPFNAAAVIGFSVPRECRVTLDIFSCTGQRVDTLAGGNFGAGSHTLVWDASGMPSGVYIVRMRAGAYTASVKAALVK